MLRYLGCVACGKTIDLSGAPMKRQLVRVVVSSARVDQELKKREGSWRLVAVVATTANHGMGGGLEPIRELYFESR